jgi:L-fuconolactonase
LTGGSGGQYTSVCAVTIDSHQHFWRYNPARDGWITDEMAVLKRDYLPEDLAPVLKANGVDSTIAVQADQSEEETRFLLELAARYDFIAGVVGWVDLRAANVGRRLEHFSRFEKLRGFRHVAQSEPDDWFLVGDDLVRGIAGLSQFGFTYDLLIYPRQLEAATALVDKSPEQWFVLDHAAKPAVRLKEIDAWARGLRALAAHPRVYCKVSGLITEADWGNWSAEDFQVYLDVVFEAFGTQRLMFGSDWPVCLLAGGYGDVRHLIAGYAGESDDIFGGNAARFYGIA